MKFDICPDCHGLTNIWVRYHKESVGDLLVLTRKPHQMLGGKNRCASVAFR